MKRFAIAGLLCLVLGVVLLGVYVSMTGPQAEPQNVEQNQAKEIEEHPPARPTMPPAMPPARPRSLVSHPTMRPENENDESLPHRPPPPPPRIQPGEDARPEEPPEMHRKEPPPSMSAQMSSLVKQTQATAGPDALALGEQLLIATNSTLRVVGMALISENNGMSDDVLKQVANDEDLSVPLNSLGWLLDAGEMDSADKLTSFMEGQSITASMLENAIDTDALTESGNRAAMNILVDSLTGEESRALFASISEDETHEYSVRMKATLLLQEILDFESFRNEVGELSKAAGEEDALWNEGIQRLNNSIQGPAEIHSGAPTLTPSDIDMMLAREYPKTLEDMAQQLEYITRQPNAYVLEGTTENLIQNVAELRNRPQSEDQQLCLTRIETIIEQLPELEQPLANAPANLPQPPPGSAQ